MDSRFDTLRSAIKGKIIREMDFSKDISDEEMLFIIDELMTRELRNLAVSVEDRKRLRMGIFHSIRKLDVLQQLVDDPSVTEIMINGADSIFIERDGIKA